MKKFMFNLSKTSTTSFIALLIILGVILISGISLFHAPADKDLAILMIGNLYGLAGFVAGYFFNKKEDKDKETP